MLVVKFVINMAKRCAFQVTKHKNARCEIHLTMLKRYALRVLKHNDACYEIRSKPKQNSVEFCRRTLLDVSERYRSYELSDWLNQRHAVIGSALGCWTRECMQRSR